MRAILWAILWTLMAAGAWAQTGARDGAQDFGALARVLPEAARFGDGRRGGAVLSLGLSQGVPWRVYTLADPDRLVVDFREVDWTGFDPEAARGGVRLEAVRVGRFRPGWSRLVADLAGPLKVGAAEMRIDDETGQARLDIRLDKVGRLAFEEASGAPHDPRWDLPAAAQRVRPRARALDGRPLVVVLDPGHGGIDPGAEAGSIDEATLMLTLARELRETLLRAGGFEVHLTRNADHFVSLEERVAIAHRLQADVFLSLHADALPEGRARGATVYVLSDKATDAADAAIAERHDREDLLAGLDLSSSDDEVAGVLLDLARQETQPRTRKLAETLVDALRNALGEINRRPLREAGFSVLKAADIPSVLIEAGFLSTEEDLRKLRDPNWRAGFTAGVRDALKAWALADAAEADLRRR